MGRSGPSGSGENPGRNPLWTAIAATIAAAATAAGLVMGYWSGWTECFLLAAMTFIAVIAYWQLAKGKRR